MNDDGDHSELLTDLALVGLRNAQAKIKILLNVKAPAGIKPRRVSVVDGLVDVLNRAICEKDAKKISGRQLKIIRARVNSEIKRLAVADARKSTAPVRFVAASGF